jgi:hypothetical protein
MWTSMRLLPGMVNFAPYTAGPPVFFRFVEARRAAKEPAAHLGPPFPQRAQPLTVRLTLRAA